MDFPNPPLGLGYLDLLFFFEGEKLFPFDRIAEPEGDFP